MGKWSQKPNFLNKVRTKTGLSREIGGGGGGWLSNKETLCGRVMDIFWDNMFSVIKYAQRCTIQTPSNKSHSTPFAPDNQENSAA